MMMRSDETLTRFIENSALVVADGLPLIWLSKLLGRPLPERVAGIDLMQDMVKSAAKTGKSVYLMGAKPGTVKKVADKFKPENPDLILAGVDDGYYSKEEEATRESGADLLVVAMGVPRQENFLNDNWNDLGVKLAIPVGGSFDVIAGETKRAPVWMQKTGMEWFYRMCQEPRRLFKRYLVTNTQFIWLGVLSIFQTRLLKRS
jgi:N-acetylglucosaminyldiphosphoundecaprenol N-acetyl-beta-D-mannosaminyltransferase